MCSIASATGPAEPAQADLAARLARAIDDLATAASADDQDVAELLARAWAMVTAADPLLAARTARYDR